MRVDSLKSQEQKPKSSEQGCNHSSLDFPSLVLRANPCTDTDSLGLYKKANIKCNKDLIKLAMSNIYIFLLKEYFVELNTANFKEINKLNQLLY